MATVSVEESKLKKVFKEALVEVLQERSDLVRDIFEEVIEDAALVKAIQAGEVTKPVTRARVMRVLEAAR